MNRALTTHRFQTALKPARAVLLAFLFNCGSTAGTNGSDISGSPSTASPSTAAGTDTTPGGGSTSSGGSANQGTTAGGSTATGSPATNTGSPSSGGSGVAGTTTGTGTGSDTGSSSSGNATGSNAGTGSDTASGSGATTSTGTSGGSGLLQSASLAFAADRVIVTGVRGTTTPAPQTIINLHNGGAAAVRVTSLAIGGTNAPLFQVTTTVPAMIMPGSDLAVTVTMSTTGATLPPAPADKNLGSTLITATLTATTGSDTAEANVFGLVLIQSNYEPTLGQIDTTLGYDLKVGQAQNNWNPNTSMNASNLPACCETALGSDEVAAPLFVKVSGAAAVTLDVVARFSPVGELPYGWYPSTSSTTRNVVGTMSQVTDPQTSDHARMVYPPLKAGSMTTFDPGTASFGLWVYSDQKTQKFGEGGNMVNGDYDFSQDALNSPANVHRMKTYPLKTAAGLVANTYMVAVEEAGNGDYQDYVFVMGNVGIAP
jgi:hypothetical protein